MVPYSVRIKESRDCIDRLWLQQNDRRRRRLLRKLSGPREQVVYCLAEMSHSRERIVVHLVFDGFVVDNQAACPLIQDAVKGFVENHLAQSDHVMVSP